MTFFLPPDIKGLTFLFGFISVDCKIFNPFMNNVEKWPNILQKSRDVHTAKVYWPFSTGVNFV